MEIFDENIIGMLRVLLHWKKKIVEAIRSNIEVTLLYELHVCTLILKFSHFACCSLITVGMVTWIVNKIQILNH